MSITPEQAFEAAKILWPGITTIKRISGTNDWYSPDPPCDTPIDWGDTDQYPPPKCKWVDPKFPEDSGKKCRFRLLENPTWHDAVLIGKDIEGNWVVDSVHGFIACKVCQVKKEPS